MPPASSEMARDELLAFLKREGFSVSPYQLLRWHHWGLMPQPRREGLGRGKGTASYYPRGAAVQARALAALLARKRNLVDAGWGLWVLGFPVTEWARDLLLGELQLTKAALKRARESLKGQRGQVTRALSRARPPRELRQMRKVATAEAMPRLFQILVDFQLGTLRAEDYSEEEWAGFQDAALHEVMPAIANDPALPSAREVAADLADLSRRVSVDQTIGALKALPNRRLEQYRNEAQWLLELAAPPERRSEAVISRDDFLGFLKLRHLNPEGERGIAAVMRQLGQARPPASHLQRWLAIRNSVVKPAPAQDP